MKLSTVSAIVIAIAAATNAASLQAQMDEQCDDLDFGRVEFRARWLDDGLGQGLRWNCIHRLNLEAQVPSYTCVDDDGICQKCSTSGEDAYSGNIIQLIHPAANSTFMEEMIVDQANLKFFCPTVTDIDILNNPSAKLTIKQNTRIAWAWGDASSSNAHGIEFYRGSDSGSSSTLIASSSLPYSQSGNFDTIIKEAGTFYWTDAVFDIDGIIVVTDSNECVGEGRDTCEIPTDLTCENSDGSFLCQNRCGNTSDCSEHQNCTDIDGVDACQCVAGYSGSMTDCEDYDECDMEIDTCEQHVQQFCSNTAGSFVCQCNVGWVVEGDTCADVNECANANLSTCSELATCSNNDGSFTCACDLGYTGNGLDCEDVKECDTNAGGCDSSNGFCNEAVGSFSCSCNKGYALDADNTTCDDIDECGLAANGTYCGDYSECNNLAGSFTCSCDKGFTGNPSDKPDKDSCTNDDECADATDDCHEDSTCTDTTGSFECACNLGYNGTGLSCSNNDECALRIDDCNEFRVCVDNDGSFTCEGFDECTTQLNGRAHNCHTDAKCTNVLDGFECKCTFGYEGNGTHCTDVNECEQANPDPFGACSQVCHNRVPGYDCSCETGYVLNGFSECNDVNECEDVDLNTCSDLAECSNMNGSFACACNMGYTGNGTFCEDIDECAIAADDCDTNGACTNTDASFRCACNLGYTGVGTTCDDVDECEKDTDNTCDTNSGCTNSAGSFSCSCDDGWGQSDADVALFANQSVYTCLEKVGCASDPCIRGTCSNNNGTFVCDCADSTEDGKTFTGYTGKLCTENVNECVFPESNPVSDCNTNSLCSDAEGSFSCECNEGYTGSGVECSNVDECDLDFDDCDDNAACTDNDGSFTCACNLPEYFGNGIMCQKSTNRYELIQKDAYLIARVGLSIVLEVRALDHFGTVTDAEERDVILKFDTSALYRTEPLDDVLVDVVDGYAKYEFDPLLVGFYNVTMVAGDVTQQATQFGHSNAYAEIKVAVNDHHAPEPEAGLAIVSGTYSFFRVNCENIDVAFLKEFADVLSTNLMYWPSLAGDLQTVVSTPESLGIPDSGGAFVTFDETLLKVSAHIGMSSEAFASKTFRSTLHAGQCSEGNSNSAVINPAIAGDVNDKITMLVQCDARGVCEGSTTSPWTLDNSITDISMVVYSDASGNIVAYCVDLVDTEDKQYLTIDSMTCGQEELPFLLSRRGQNKTLLVDFSFTVPDASAEETIERFENVDVDSIKSDISESSLLAPLFNGSVTAGEFTARHNGIDCNVDDWTDYSECSQTCNTGKEGTRTRRKQCPPMTEVLICDSFDVPCETTPTCADGHCSADASCQDNVVGDPTCVCGSGFIGDGVGAEGCITEESDFAYVKLQYNDQVTRYAPTAMMQRQLREDIVATAENQLGVIGDGRIIMQDIDVHFSGESFVVTFLIKPRTFASQGTAMSFADVLSASVQQQAFTTKYGALEIEYTPVFIESMFQYPAAAATHTSTLTATSATETTVTGTSTTFITSTTFTTVQPTSTPTALPTVSTAAPTSTPTMAPAIGIVLSVEDNNTFMGNTDYQVLLLGCLLVVFLSLMAVVMVMAVKQNSRAKLQELVSAPLSPTSTVINPNSNAGLTGKFESTPAEESKWLNIDSRYDTSPN